MSKKLTKQEVERLIAALDDRGLDEDAHLAQLRAAATVALARLVGRTAPWPQLVNDAATIAGWAPGRVARLRGDVADRLTDAVDALYELITELNETRRL
jgi:hypothetical protein